MEVTTEKIIISKLTVVDRLEYTSDEGEPRIEVVESTLEIHHHSDNRLVCASDRLLIPYSCRSI